MLFPAYLMNAQERNSKEQKIAESNSIDQIKMNQFIDNLISRMTLEEKVGQMNQIPGFFAITSPVKPDSELINWYKKRTGRFNAECYWSRTHNAVAKDSC